MYKIFLGGTCAGTKRRDELTPLLRGGLDYFNPIVEDWSEADIMIEEIEKKMHCQIHLYVLTSEMQGVYSVAEAIQSSHTPSIFTVIQVDPTGFTDGQLKSLDATLDLLKLNGAYARISNDIPGLTKILNNI